MRPSPVPAAALDALRAAAATTSARKLHRDLGLHPKTVAALLAGGRASPDTLVKLSRIAPRVREKDEFANATKEARRAPRLSQAVDGWSIESIRAARNAQMRGDFGPAVRLAKAMGADDAIFTSRANRIAPQSCISALLQPVESARGKALCARAAAQVFAPRSVLTSITATMVEHGIAIGYIEHEPEARGVYVSMRLTEWPLEHVKWDASREVLTTATRDGDRVDIQHGDSRWVVFRTYATEPWAHAACLLPGALLWAAHTPALADWASSIRAHGLAKLMGELPEGVSLVDHIGQQTPEAAAFLNLLNDMVQGNSCVGIRPAGSKTDIMMNGSTAYQVFDTFANNREKAAARIWQGTDAALGSMGGGPGVDIAALFGVATTKVQGDFMALEEGLNTGLYQPWAAINDGSSRYAPSIRYQMPDPDEDAKRAQYASNVERLGKSLAVMRDQKLTVDQDVVNRLAAIFGITPAPRLAAMSTDTSSLVLAPTDIAKVVKVVEARAANALPAFGDERDQLTLSELDARTAAKANAPTNGPAPAVAPPAAV